MYRFESSLPDALVNSRVCLAAEELAQMLQNLGPCDEVSVLLVPRIKQLICAFNAEFPGVAYAVYIRDDISGAVLLGCDPYVGFPTYIDCVSHAAPRSLNTSPFTTMMAQDGQRTLHDRYVKSIEDSSWSPRSTRRLQGTRVLDAGEFILWSSMEPSGVSLDMGWVVEDFPDSIFNCRDTDDVLEKLERIVGAIPTSSAILVGGVDSLLLLNCDPRRKAIHITSQYNNSESASLPSRFSIDSVRSPNFVSDDEFEEILPHFPDCEGLEIAIVLKLVCSRFPNVDGIVVGTGGDALFEFLGNTLECDVRGFHQAFTSSSFELDILPFVCASRANEIQVYFPYYNLVPQAVSHLMNSAVPWWESKSFAAAQLNLGAGGEKFGFPDAFRGVVISQNLWRVGRDELARFDDVRGMAGAAVDRYLGLDSASTSGMGSDGNV